jgi:hypothetical protein
MLRELPYSHQTLGGGVLIHPNHLAGIVGSLSFSAPVVPKTVRPDELCCPAVGHAI